MNTAVALRELLSRTQSRLCGIAWLPKLCRGGNARPEVGDSVLDLKGHQTAPTAATEKPRKGTERSLLVTSRISNAVQGVVILFVPWVCVRISRYGRLQALAGTQTERRAVPECVHSDHRLLFSLFSRNPESFYEIGGFQTTLARNMVKLCRGFVPTCRTSIPNCPRLRLAVPKRDCPLSEPRMHPRW